MEIDSTSDSTVVEGRFRSPTLRRHKGLMPTTLVMESTAKAGLWIDRIRVERIDPESQSPVDPVIPDPWVAARVGGSAIGDR